MDTYDWNSEEHVASRWWSAFAGTIRQIAYVTRPLARPRHGHAWEWSRADSAVPRQHLGRRAAGTVCSTWRDRAARTRATGPPGGEARQLAVRPGRVLQHREPAAAGTDANHLLPVRKTETPNGGLAHAWRPLSRSSSTLLCLTPSVLDRVPLFCTQASPGAVRLPTGATLVHTPPLWPSLRTQWSTSLSSSPPSASFPSCCPAAVE